ncbi:MAG: hypothetical protein QMD05_08950 [Candidatus Brocadiaceae bacterium]|nr:hypothetical protein [Candidatus Brocadiaceae bacterium]
MGILELISSVLGLAVPHNIWLYGLYYLGLHLGFRKLESIIDIESQKRPPAPKLDLLFDQARQSVEEQLSHLLPPSEKDKIDSYESFLQSITEELKKSPPENLLGPTLDLQKALGYLSEKIASVCNSHPQLNGLDTQCCQMLVGRLLGGMQGVLADLPEKDQLQKSILDFLTSLKTKQLATHKSIEEINKLLKDFARKQEEEGLLPPKVSYENYFKAVERRREEEFQRLGHYVALPTIETKLAEPGKEAGWATEVIERCIQNRQNAVISGESGSGKTFTFLKLFHEFKKRYLNDEWPCYIPLFVELYKLKDCSFPDLLNGNYLNEKIDDHRYQRDKSKYIVFLDGLNEAPDSEEAFKDIKTLSPRTFISTQRKYEFIKESFGPTFQIQPLEPPQVIDYLCRLPELFPSSKEAGRFYDGLDELLKEHIKRPVILFFLVTLYKETQGIPHNLCELFTQFADFVCERRLGGQISEPISRRYKEEVLPLVAFSMCRRKERTLSSEDLKDIINSKFGVGVDFYDFENQAARRYWLLRERESSSTTHGRGPTPARHEKKYFEFTLELLRDYFSARYIKNLQSMDSQELLKLIFPEDSAQSDPTFSSVSEILCGIVSEQEAVKIINAILPRDPYLAASCLARSSITGLQEELLKQINSKIDVNDPRYFLSIKRQ